MPAPLQPSREQILAFRRRVASLDERLPPGAPSLRTAAWAGLQDSMPRAALLSLHARVQGCELSTWEDPSLVQLWGPRFSAYVVAAEDRAVFTLGRLPDNPNGRQRAVDTAERLGAFLGDRRMSYEEVGRALGVDPNMLRYATTTGRVLLRWEGARRPTIWMVPAPEVDPHEARLELARRFLHVFGPSTPDAFAAWAGIRRGGHAAFDALGTTLTPVVTPIGDAWILAEDEAALREAPAGPAPARLLPSGDSYFLLQGADRELLVPDAAQRSELWTSRVWPGAVLVRGEVVGTWRRDTTTVRVRAWRRLPRADRDAIEAEARSFPLAGAGAPILVRWLDEA